jgi:hypothetical protein
VLLGAAAWRLCALSGEMTRTVGRRMLKLASGDAAAMQRRFPYIECTPFLKGAEGSKGTRTRMWHSPPSAMLY